MDSNILYNIFRSYVVFNLSQKWQKQIRMLIFIHNKNCEYGIIFYLIFTLIKFGLLDFYLYFFKGFSDSFNYNRNCTIGISFSLCKRDYL